jgi:hypothetical protein
VAELKRRKGGRKERRARGREGKREGRKKEGKVEWECWKKEKRNLG